MLESLSMKQLSLFKNEGSDFGGNLTTKGKRKVRRPLSLRRPMHLVLKSTKAKGTLAFSPTDQKLRRLIHKMATRFGVRIYSQAQNWSHIHLVLRIPSRNSYCAFVRALAGSLVKTRRAGKGFFDLLPFTKLCSWGRQFKNLKNYCAKNEMQAWGLLAKANAPQSKIENLTFEMLCSDFQTRPLVDNLNPSAAQS
jgi:REP element-mobilizing transposase RayT